jgi:cbb3-type cytochrome oxidase subunit 1
MSLALMAAIYYIVPIISGKSIVWPKLINWIFWIFTIAGVSTCVLLLIGGVVGGSAFAAGITGSQLMAIITPYLMPSAILCTITAIAGVMFVVQILVSLSRHP